MLNHDPAANPMWSISSLAERARKIDPQDVTRQYVDPARWSDISAAIGCGFERLLSDKGVADASSYLKQAYELFFEAGLRGPCRVALGCMARIVDEYDSRADFELLAARELSLTIPFSEIQDVRLQVSLAANEVVCWNAARTLIEHQPGSARRVLQTALELIRTVDADWRIAARNDLWRMHAASLSLRTFCAKSRNLSGTEVILMKCATRYFADFVLSLTEKEQQLRDLSAESAFRPLAYKAQAALDEYNDFTLGDRTQEMLQLVQAGDGAGLLKLGLSVVHCIGRLLCKSPDIRQVEGSCLRFLSIWRDWWELNKSASPRQAAALMSAQARIVSAACVPFMLIIEDTSDAAGLQHLVGSILTFLGAPETKEARAPASTMAPLRLLCGRIWERIAQLEEDFDAPHHALEQYIEGCRLLTLSSIIEHSTPRDLLASVDRLLEVRPLCAREQGVVRVLRGRLLLELQEYSEALEQLLGAIEPLCDAIDDPELLGLKSLTLLTGRVCQDAARAAEKLGDCQQGIALLNRGAEILERTAEHFKVQAARGELLAVANSYRMKATEKSGATTAVRGDSGGSEMV